MCKDLHGYQMSEESKTKMKAAEDMLRQRSNYHNKDLAEALGYGETQNFCRVFKKYFGVSPQEFRKQNENK